LSIATSEYFETNWKINEFKLSKEEIGNMLPDYHESQIMLH